MQENFYHSLINFFPINILQSSKKSLLKVGSPYFAMKLSWVFRFLSITSSFPTFEGLILEFPHLYIAGNRNCQS